MAGKIIRFPEAIPNSITAIPRNMSVGSLLDSLEERFPHMKINGQSIEISFATWLMLLMDKRVASGLSEILTSAELLGYSPAHMVAEMIGEYIECSMEPLLHAAPL